GMLPLLLLVTTTGCQTIMNGISQKRTHWKMLDDKSLEDPIAAVGGDGIVFVPGHDNAAMTRQQLMKATPEVLVNYYSPIVVQQKVDTRAQKYPYPPEYDMIGEAKLKREANGKLTSYVAGPPKVY